MKKLIFKLILPLSIISFTIFTKWWYILPVDAPDTMFRGFPLIYSGPGWHTSLSFQIFVVEFIFDFLIYFLFWFVLIFCINRFVVMVKLNKLVTITLWTLSGFFMIIGVFFACNSDNIFFVKRPYEIHVLKTGYEFIWQNTQRP